MSITRPQCDLRNALQFLRLVDPTELDNFPDFLVIGPPKTGTTWLSRQLSRHPGIFVPAMKEVKYFNSYRNSENLGWYLSVFKEASGRLKGDVTPNYALLPGSTIDLIHGLRPEIKLIFLMRDPVERAWSHARWDFGRRSHPFSSCDEPIDEVTDAMWRESFCSARSVLFGDYLGQMQRWLSIFDRGQFFPAFIEDARRNPREFLNRVFDFLEISRPTHFEDADLHERVNPGLPLRLAPELLECLRRIYDGRTRQLVEFLRGEFAISPPPEWENTMARPDVGEIAAQHGDDGCESFCVRLAQSTSDAQFDELLKQEELLHPRLVESRSDWNILEFQGRFYGVPRAIGPIDFFNSADLARPEILTAATACEIELQIERRSAPQPPVVPVERPLLVERDYAGYNIVHFQGRYIALAQSLGPVDLTQADDGWRAMLRRPSDAFIAGSVIDARQQIDRLSLDRTQESIRQMHDQIRQLLQRQQQFEESLPLNELLQGLQAIQEQVSRLDAQIERIAERAWTWRKVRLFAARLIRRFIPGALVAAIREGTRDRRAPDAGNSASAVSNAAHETRRAA